MGVPTYRPTSYDGKGSTNTSRTKTKISAMVEILKLLEEVERCREVVTDRQSDLDSAKKDLERAEQKVLAQINKLDPETKARFRRMMGGIGNQEPGDGNEER